MTRIPLVALLAVALAATVPARARTITVPDASFELNGAVETLACTEGLLDLPESIAVVPWSCSGDVVVTRLNACMTPQLPSDGSYAACLSTGSLFGGIARGDVSSSLVSPPIDLGLRPDQITVSFDLVYGTEEGLQSAVLNDTLSVTLLTGAGPFPLVAADTWGMQPKGGNLKVTGGTPLGTPNLGCPVLYETGRITVVSTRSIPPSAADAVRNLPIFLQFDVRDLGDTSRTTFVCFDHIQVKASPVN